MKAETRDSQGGTRVNRDALAAYLRWHLTDGQIAGLRLDDEVQVTPAAGPHATPTYVVRLGGAELLLQIADTAAHPERPDVAREFQWLTALHPLYDLAPRPFLLCEDASVLGATFSIVVRRRGVVITEGEEPLPLAGHPTHRREASEAAVDALVALHDVDATLPAIAAVDAPDGYLDRRVREALDRWHRARTAPVPDMDAVALWLSANEPPGTLDPSVVHGGYVPSALLVNPLAPAEASAVLGWSLAALGDPLCDVAVMIATWQAMADGHGDSGSARPGYLGRDDMADRYAQRSGRDLSALPFYEVLALFRLALDSRRLGAGGRARYFGARARSVASATTR